MRLISTADYNLRHQRTFDLPNIETNRFFNTYIPSSWKFAYSLVCKIAITYFNLNM